MQNVTHTGSSTPRPTSRRLRAAALLVAAGLSAPVGAADYTWNAGDGFWSNANNWLENATPSDPASIYIGTLPGVQNSTVMMGNGVGTVTYDYFELANGMTLDLNGSELGSLSASALIYGNNTRLIARPSVVGLNQHDFQGALRLFAGAHLELRDGVEIRLFQNGGVPSYSYGTISGRGHIEHTFINNGVIRPDNNGGISIAGHTFDMDGVTDAGHLDLTTQFSVLTVNSTQLADAFSGTISMAPGALLSMNVDNGWAADAPSVINVAGFNNPAAASQINGSHLTFGGVLNVGAAQGHLRVLSDMTIQNSALVNVGHTDWVEFDGATTVQGGVFLLDLGARIDFDGPATMQGGQFETASNSLVDGGVYFNGETDWRGNVVIDGAARQNGDATVSGGLGASITAGMFDMDGAAGNTNWDVNANFVVNADNIGTTAANYFGGVLDVGGGFTPRVTINLTDPNASWIMGGALEMTGDASFYHTRLGGSHMIVQGDLELSPGRAQITADTTFSGAAGGADVTLAANADLRMQGRTVVENGVDFHGTGTLRVGVNGDMTIEDGVSLGAVGLVNDGALRIDDAAGIINVDRFTNGANGTWVVSLGGHTPGDEHDLLNVLNDAALGGAIAVEHLDLGAGVFRPHVGDEFTVLTAAGGVSGAFLFDPVSQVGTTTYEWTVLYNPSSVVLRLDNVVPTPGAATIACLAGLAGARRRRPC